jgi:hypothetical protein
MGVNVVEQIESAAADPELDRLLHSLRRKLHSFQAIQVANQSLQLFKKHYWHLSWNLRLA